MTRLRALLVAAVLLVAGMPAPMAADGGLVLGFERQHGAVDRTSMSEVANAPTASNLPDARWTMIAVDHAGAQLWRWPLREPRRFHPASDGRSEFVLVVPRVAAGTELTLRDRDGRTLWSERLGSAELERARQRGADVAARAADARAATTALQSRPVSAALTRQLIAQQPRGPTATSLQAAAPLSQTAEQRLSSRSNLPPDLKLTPESITKDAIDKADGAQVTGGGSPVQISVIDENGVAPMSAVSAHLFRDDDDLGLVEFDGNGQAVVNLEVGGNYALNFTPLAPLVAVRKTFHYSGAALPPFVLEIGWILDVHLHDANDQPIAGEHSASLTGVAGAASRLYPLTPGSSPGHLRFAVTKNPTALHYLEVAPADGDHTHFSHRIGYLSGAQSTTLRLAKAAAIPGEIHVSDGSPPPPGGVVSCTSNDSDSDISYQAIAQIGDGGVFELRTPLQLATSCWIDAPASLLDFNFTRTFHDGDTISIALLRGVSVRFLIQNQQGELVAGADGFWNHAPSQSNGSCYSNPCEIEVPQELAIAMSFRFAFNDHAPINLAPQLYQGGSEHIIVAQALHQVSGQVINAEPFLESSTRVRVFDASGRFIQSRIGAQFDFRLPDGNYRIEADANLPSPAEMSAWTFRSPASSGLVSVAGDSAVPDLSLPTERGDIEFVVDRPCWVANQSVQIAFTAPDGRRIDHVRNQRYDVPIPTRPPGQCASVHTLGLSPGHYVIEIAPLGWPPQLIDTTIVAGQVQNHALDFAANARTRVWQGTLVDADQQPVSNAALFVDHIDQLPATAINVNAQGQFEIPFVPGWGVKAWVFGPGTDHVLGDSRRFGSSPPDPVWQLARSTFQSTPDAGLIRIHGNGQRVRKRNIVFVAEGYTNVHESFSDQNGNGIWDGVAWYDLNANGVYDAAQDRSWIYGSASPPQEGLVPTTQNEPFGDLNGDGLLSVNDPAMFLANSRSFMRSLLASDVWNEHRDSFNAWVLFLPSAQAGYDIISPNGQVLLSRNTRYGGSLPLVNQVLDVDRTAMLEEAIAVLPEVDLVVAMVNEPVPGSRANATFGDPGVIVIQGGLPNNDSNSTVQSHEMGHFVAHLCDEYSTEAGEHPLSGSPDFDLNCANATVKVDPTQVPWSALLPAPPSSWPTVDNGGVLGLFEGAGYYLSGAYRPTFESTMRSARPFFNAPSRLAIEAAIAAHATAGEVLFASGFE